jgi:Fe-S oxidoreductase
MKKYLEQERARAIEKCTACGVCAKKCPIIEHTGLKDLRSKEIQKAVKRFLTSAEANDTVYTRAFACMECFKFVAQCCPEGLNPLLINEMIKWEYQRKHWAEMPAVDPSAPDSDQRVLASIQVRPKEYRRILTPTKVRGARYLFFPGCNVYMQPEKLLNALDILSAIVEDCAFLPGLDFCCGDVHYNSQEDHFA